MESDRTEGPAAKGSRTLAAGRWVGRRLLAPTRRRFWKRATLQLKAVRLFATELIILGVVIGGTILIVHEVNTPSVRISVSAVPEEWRSNGLAEAVVTELVRAELETIQVKSATSMERATTWREEQAIQFSIPGTGLGFGDIVQQIKRFVGKSDMAITVYMAKTNGQFGVSLRSTTQELPLPRGWLVSSTESEAIHIAAEQIARATQPFILASYYYSVGDKEKCHKLIDEIHHAFPANTPIRARAYNLLGLLSDDAGDYDAALREYDLALTHNPTAYYVYLNIGNAYFNKNDYDNAVAFYRKGIEVEPDSLTFNGLGNALNGQGKHEDAVSAYQRAIELDANNADAFNGLGNALDNQGKLDEALVAYQGAIDRDSSYAYAFLGRGNVFKKQNKPADATAAYQRAIEIDPTLFSAFNGLGNVLSDEHKFDQAVAAYKKSIEINPKSAIPWANLCITQFENDHKEDARTSCTTAWMLDSEDKRIADLYQSYFGALPDINTSTAAGGQAP